MLGRGFIGRSDHIKDEDMATIKKLKTQRILSGIGVLVVVALVISGGSS